MSQKKINVNYDTKKIESYKVLCFKNLVGDFSLLSRETCVIAQHFHKECIKSGK